MVPGAGPEADQWFVDQGLPWFVPERREAAHRALHSKHTLAGMVLISLAALALGVVLAYLTAEVSVAPATMVTLIGLAVLGYAGRELARGRSRSGPSVARCAACDCSFRWSPAPSRCCCCS